MFVLEVKFGLMEQPENAKRKHLVSVIFAVNN